MWTFILLHAISHLAPLLMPSMICWRFYSKCCIDNTYYHKLSKKKLGFCNTKKNLAFHNEIVFPKLVLLHNKIQFRKKKLISACAAIMLFNGNAFKANTHWYLAYWVNTRPIGKSIKSYSLMRSCNVFEWFSNFLLSFSNVPA